MPIYNDKLGLTYDESSQQFVLTLQERGALQFTLDWPGRDVTTWGFKLQIRPTLESRTVLLELSRGNGITPGSDTGKVQFFFSIAKTNKVWRQAVFDLRVSPPSGEVFFLRGIAQLQQTVTQTTSTEGPPTTSTGGEMPNAAISSANSTVIPLSANSAFTGVSESSLSFGSVSVAVLADVASAVDGLVVEQSQDGTNWDIGDYVDVAANQSAVITVNMVSEFYRVLYTNGGSNQGTFRLETRRNPYRIDTPDGGRSDIPSKSTVQTLTTTSDVAIVPAPGANKSILVRRLTAYNTSGILTRVDIKDDTTVFQYLAAAASGGSEVYVPWRKILAENKALNGALRTSVIDVGISCEYVIVKS